MGIQIDMEHHWTKSMTLEKQGVMGCTIPQYRIDLIIMIIPRHSKVVPSIHDNIHLSTISC
jgi:hypothetical protein